MKTGIYLFIFSRFDPGGPGSCLKRYSDPSFFRRASIGAEVAYSDKILKDKKGRKIKVCLIKVAEAESIYWVI